MTFPDRNQFTYAHPSDRQRHKAACARNFGAILLCIGLLAMLFSQT